MYWIYKCNSKGRAHQRTWGDWSEVFDSAEPRWWGTTRVVPELGKAKIGNTIIAYQTDRNELVGVATLIRWDPDGANYKRMVLKPSASLGVKVRPLKIANARIRNIKALQPGPIRTLYEISDSDARALLRAAGMHLRAIGSEKESVEPSLKGAGFGTPEKNRLVEQAAMRHVRKHYEDSGWRVINVSKEKGRGYDLLCRRARTERHVEVKGSSGDSQKFVITMNELAKWRKDPQFVLAFVPRARNARPSINFFPGRSGRNAFEFQPLAYMARRLA